MVHLGTSSAPVSRLIAPHYRVELTFDAFIQNQCRKSFMSKSFFIIHCLGYRLAYIDCLVTLNNKDSSMVLKFSFFCFCSIGFIIGHSVSEFFKTP